LVRFFSTLPEKITVQYPEEKRISPRATAAGSFFRAIRMAVSAVWRATLCAVACLRLHRTAGGGGQKRAAVSGVLPYQLFRAASFAAIARKPAPTYAIQLTPDFEMGEFHRRTWSTKSTTC